MSPGDIFNAEVIAVAVAVVVFVIVLMAIGIALVFIGAITTFVFVVWAIVSLSRRDYAMAGLCLIPTLLCLPITYSVYRAGDEWRRTDEFKKKVYWTTPSNGKPAFYLKNGDIVVAGSEAEAALGYGKKFTGYARKKFIEKQIVSEFASRGVVRCSVNISNQAMDVYVNSQWEKNLAWTWGPEEEMHDLCYIFQKNLGLNQTSLVKVRLYNGERLLARTGQMQVINADNQWFIRREYVREIYIYGKKEFDRGLESWRR